MNPLELLQKELESKTVVLFGTGKASEKVARSIPRFDYYVDNDASKHGTILNGRMVKSPKVLLEEDKDRLLVVVSSSYYNEISAQLSNYGLMEGIHYIDGLNLFKFLYIKRFAEGLCVDGIRFTDFVTNKFGSHSVGFHDRYIIKIEHYRLELKANSLAREIAIIKRLNDQNCVTCPRIISTGKLPTGEDYYIQERIYSRGRPSSADLLLALIEQKNLGVFHGDLKPENILFDGQICYLIDYDQAIYDPDLANLSNREFFEFMEKDSLTRFGKSRWDLYGNYFDRDEMLFLLRNDSFDLAKTSLFLQQVTTQETDGVYHHLETEKVYVKGARDFSARIPLMDQIQFRKNERVLDVGCNMGLLAHYLHDRGCEVIGIDLDPAIVKIAQIVANILGKKVTFRHMDIDKAVLEQTFDTVCFFSVLQHVEDLRKLGQTIVRFCDRIIIENRLSEFGRKPVNGVWKKTTSWYFEDLSQMTNFFETIFPGFRFAKCYGQADRRRYILEYLKR